MYTSPAPTATWSIPYRLTRRTTSATRPGPPDSTRDVDSERVAVTSKAEWRHQQPLQSCFQIPAISEQENVEQTDGRDIPAHLEDSTAVVASLLHGIDQTTVEEDTAPQAPPPLDPCANEVMCVTVHCTDSLKASVHLSHPVVRVSMVDAEGGECIKKSSMDRCVASFYERDNPSVDYILPVMTQPFNCQKHK